MSSRAPAPREEHAPIGAWGASLPRHGVQAVRVARDVLSASCHATSAAVVVELEERAMAARLREIAAGRSRSWLSGMAVAIWTLGASIVFLAVLLFHELWTDQASLLLTHQVPDYLLLGLSAVVLAGLFASASVDPVAASQQLRQALPLEKTRLRGVWTRSCREWSEAGTVLVVLLPADGLSRWVRELMAGAIAHGVTVACAQDEAERLRLAMLESTDLHWREWEFADWYAQHVQPAPDPGGAGPMLGYLRGLARQRLGNHAAAADASGFDLEDMHDADACVLVAAQWTECRRAQVGCLQAHSAMWDVVLWASAAVARRAGIESIGYTTLERSMRRIASLGALRPMPIAARDGVIDGVSVRLPASLLQAASAWAAGRGISRMSTLTEVAQRCTEAATSLEVRSLQRYAILSHAIMATTEVLEDAAAEGAAGDGLVAAASRIVDGLSATMFAREEYPLLVRTLITCDLDGDGASDAGEDALCGIRDHLTLSGRVATEFCLALLYCGQYEQALARFGSLARVRPILGDAGRIRCLERMGRIAPALELSAQLFTRLGLDPFLDAPELDRTVLRQLSAELAAGDDLVFALLNYAWAVVTGWELGELRRATRTQQLTFAILERGVVGDPTSWWRYYNTAAHLEEMRATAGFPHDAEGLARALSLHLEAARSIGGVPRKWVSGSYANAGTVCRRLAMALGSGEPQRAFLDEAREHLLRSVAMKSELRDFDEVWIPLHNLALVELLDPDAVTTAARADRAVHYAAEAVATLERIGSSKRAGLALIELAAALALQGFASTPPAAWVQPAERELVLGSNEAGILPEICAAIPRRDPAVVAARLAADGWFSRPMAERVVAVLCAGTPPAAPG